MRGREIGQSSPPNGNTMPLNILSGKRVGKGEKRINAKVEKGHQGDRPEGGKYEGT